MSDNHIPITALKRTLQHPMINQVVESLKRPVAVRLTYLVAILLACVVFSEHFILPRSDIPAPVSGLVLQQQQSPPTHAVIAHGAVPRGQRGLEERLEDIKNSTLGFQRIFAIGMKERTDKRDTFSLIAKLSGFDVEWVDGVQGDSILTKAIPENFAKTRWAKDMKTIACWRAHINIAQRMINENIQTALVLEDDADWDVFLRDQLAEYARGVNHLQSIAPLDPEKEPAPYTDSPFGDDWDLQWVGNCGTECAEKVETNYYIIGDDPTAIPDALFQRNRGIPNFTPAPLLESNYTRAIFPPRETWCTYGYGLSLRGARRSLYLQTVGNRANAIDQAFDEFCTGKTLGFNCFAVFPPLIGTHRPAGSADRDSDRDDNVVGSYREKASSVSIVYSMILNLKNLLEGKTTVESQWPGQTMLDSIKIGSPLPRGQSVLITPDQYSERFWEPRFGGPKYNPPW